MATGKFGQVIVFPTISIADPRACGEARYRKLKLAMTPAGQLGLNLLPLGIRSRSMNSSNHSTKGVDDNTEFEM